MHLEDLMKDLHETSVLKGWWEEERPIPELLCLIHSEVSEALEAYRNNDDVNFREELADVAIRLFICAKRFTSISGSRSRRNMK